jgi:hypothetical protein
MVELSFMCTVLLLNEVYPPMKFQVDTSNSFLDILRTKMSEGRTDGWMDGRTEGQTDGDYFYIPSRLSAGDKKNKGPSTVLC